MNKKKTRHQVLVKGTALAFALAMMAGMAPVLAQTTYYFDQNGITAGFGLTNGTTYDWNTTDVVWNSSSSGGGPGPLGAWNNAANDTANFNLTGLAAGNSITVDVQENLTVGGLRSGGSNHVVNFTADSSRTITMAANAVVYVTGGVQSRGLIIGDNVNLSGNFEIQQTGSNGNLQIKGTGATYSGTITLNGVNTGFYLTNDSRINNQSNFVLNSGRLGLASGTVATIGSLSGNGGAIAFDGTNVNKITIDQETDTSWGGTISSGAGNNYISVTKDGSGRLSLTSLGTHYLATNRSLDVDEGELYVAGSISTGGAAGSTAIAVAADATLGGTLTTNKLVQLSSASSILDAGMYGQAGTMTLENGLDAASGGIFSLDFDMDVASRIDVTGGTLTLGGVKVVNLYNLGFEYEILRNSPYVLMDANGSTGVWDTDFDNWSFNFEGAGWGTLPNDAVWSLENRQLTLSFVPEPSVIGLLLGAAGVLCFLIRKRRMV